jgi:hypothetical protein
MHLYDAVTKGLPLPITWRKMWSDELGDDLVERLAAFGVGLAKNKSMERFYYHAIECKSYADWIIEDDDEQERGIAFLFLLAVKSQEPLMSSQRASDIAPFAIEWRRRYAAADVVEALLAGVHPRGVSLFLDHGIDGELSSALMVGSAA